MNKPGDVLSYLQLFQTLGHLLDPLGVCVLLPQLLLQPQHVVLGGAEG